jgi:hypothetical protein
MTDIKITLDPDGAELHMVEGDAIRENGVENLANLALLTKDGHWSEDFETSPDAKYKGNYLKTNKLPITRDNLITVARAAEKDLAGPPFGEINSLATNPIGQQQLLETVIKPVNSDPFVLSLTKNGQNYIQQILDPAYLKV